MVAPGYYRYIGTEVVDCYKGDLKPNGLVYVTHQDDYVRFVWGESGMGYSEDQFWANFIPAPEGREERRKQLHEALDSVDDFETAHASLDARVKLMESSSVLALGGPSGEPAAETGTEIVTTGRSVDELKKSLADAKRELAGVANDLKERQGTLQALLNEKKAIAMAKVREMQAVMKLMGEAITMVNLYLGNEEEIVQIGFGEPASEEAKIHIHQEVLFMDEETALFEDLAEKGGIDFKNIEAFDRWLMANPDHIRSVIPEERAIVALRPRRKEKDYFEHETERSMAAAFANAEMNKRNQATYILLRNGSQIYRICSELRVKSHVFPDHDEYQKHFEKTEFDWESRERTTEFIRPGTPEYMEAMKRADENQRGYLKTLLFLQGLLDRTKVFHPLARPRVNVMNAGEYADTLVFVRDGEKALDSGRPSFYAWLKETNSKLDVGQRIVANFPYDRDEARSRVSPRGAGRPNDQTVYVLEDKVGDGEYRLFFSRGYYWRESARRASYRVFKTDPWLVAIDQINLADVEYYLNSRRDRPNYKEMLPLLKMAVKLRKAEAAEEKPFRDLLVSYIARERNLDPEEMASTVDELIHWWKFKNRTHRALLSDDSKALRMITDEFDIRNKRHQERRRLFAGIEEVAIQIRANGADYVLIAHKSGNEYVALRRANAKNTFVHEELWKTNRGIPRLVETKEWAVVDNRYQRWQSIWESEAWEEWNKGAHRASHYSDPELVELQVLALAKAEEYGKRGHIRRHRSEELIFDNDYEAIAVGYNSRDNEMVVFAREVKLRDDIDLTTDDYLRFDFTILRLEFKISRKGKGFDLPNWPSPNHYCYYDHGRDRDKEKKAPWHQGQYHDHIETLQIFPQAEANILKLVADCDRLGEQRSKIVWERQQPWAAVERVLRARYKAGCHKRFIDEGGHEDNWKETEKNLPHFEPPPNDARDRITFLFQKGKKLAEFDGQDIDWVYTESDRLGFKPKQVQDDEESAPKDDPKLVRLTNVVIQIPKSEEEEYAD